MTFHKKFSIVSRIQIITKVHYMLNKKLGGFWAPFHGPNEYFLARQLP